LLLFFADAFHIGQKGLGLLWRQQRSEACGIAHGGVWIREESRLLLGELLLLLLDKLGAKTLR